MTDTAWVQRYEERIAMYSQHHVSAYLLHQSTPLHYTMKARRLLNKNLKTGVMLTVPNIAHAYVVQ